MHGRLLRTRKDEFKYNDDEAFFTNYITIDSFEVCCFIIGVSFYVTRSHSVVAVLSVGHHGHKSRFKPEVKVLPFYHLFIRPYLYCMQTILNAPTTR